MRADDLCACREPASTCPVWGQAIAETPAAREGTISFGQGRGRTARRILRALFRGRPAPESASVARLNHALLSAAAEATGAAVVVDSSKGVGRLREFVMSGLLDVHIVHLIRDARGVMWSKAKSIRRLAEEHPEMLPAMERNPSQLLVRSPWWTMRRRAALNLIAMVLGVSRWRGKYRVVIYEQLATSPKEAVRGLADWVGGLSAPADDAVERVPHNIGGNRVRLRLLKTIRIDDEWRSKLGANARLAYVLSGGPLVGTLARALAARCPSTTDARRL